MHSSAVICLWCVELCDNEFETNLLYLWYVQLNEIIQVLLA
jgi:hypothetical protein